MKAVQVDKAGRLKVPEEMLSELAVLPGDTLDVSVRGRALVLQPRRTTGKLVRKGKLLVYRAPGMAAITRETTNALITDARQGAVKRIASRSSKQKR